MRGNVMIQGTMSNAGKSLFTAGLLRILKQDGFSAAPFKSQNMALNSYVTIDGLEMGRAQAIQAEAAGIEPEADMNPILLKPHSDMTSQVILGGKAVCHMRAAEYFRKKREFVSDIMAAYQRLAQKYEIIVLEGAGSPAEINLKQNDIVNMGMAEMVDAPVILIGDIDRGGVFAQLYGTAALLEEGERKRIKGFVMNKFRGDKSLLTPGIEMLYERCRIPVVGVVPYADIDIEEEDSLAQRLAGGRRPDVVDIAVIRLPHLSNFTDFNPLEKIEGVSVRYISVERELGSPDLIIVPGTKNTMDDLRWMRENGMEEAVRRLASCGRSLLLGICGGFQMLGMQLCDPDCVEEGGSMRGMGMLPLRTIFKETKVVSRVRGEIVPMESGVCRALSGGTFSGYEIHMGVTEMPEDAGRLADIASIDGSGISRDGCVSGGCMGTYVHGIFESGTLRNRLLQLLFTRKGLVWNGDGGTDYAAYKNRQYDLLADLIRENTDMKAIRQMIGLT